MMLNLDLPINVKELGFKVNRFWSSPEKLPLRNVIGVILNNPTLEDVRIISDKFGIDTVRYAFEEMQRNNELKAGQIKYDNAFINLLELPH